MDIFDLPEYNRTTDEQQPDEMQDTSFTYDTDTQYNTDSVNLQTSDGMGFTSPIKLTRGRAIEVIRRDWEEWERRERKLTLNVNDLKETIKKPQIGLRSTDEGIKLVAERIEVKGGDYHFFPNPRYFDVKNMTDVQIGNLSPDKSIRLTKVKPRGELYPLSTMATLYSTDFVRYFKNLIETPDKTSWYSHQIEQMDNEPSTRQTQEMQLNPETLKFIEELMRGEKPITQLQDATEEELKGLGFHESALREWRGMRTASDDLASAKQVRDMKIQELEKQNQELGKKVNDLVTQYINSTAMEVADKNDLEKKD